MNKEKAELYAMLFARAYLVAETSENGEYEATLNYASGLLDEIDEEAKNELTEEEYEYYQKITDSPNRTDWE